MTKKNKQSFSGKIKRYLDLFFAPLFHSAETSNSYIFYYLLVVNMIKHIFLLEIENKWQEKDFFFYTQEQSSSSNWFQPFKFDLALQSVSLKNTVKTLHVTESKMADTNKHHNFFSFPLASHWSKSLSMMLK